MVSHEHFLRAIAADRESDAPYLIYADWLEENGYVAMTQEIRTQVQLRAERKMALSGTETVAYHGMLAAMHIPVQAGVHRSMMNSLSCTTAPVQERLGARFDFIEGEDAASWSARIFG